MGRVSYFERCHAKVIVALLAQLSLSTFVAARSTAQEQGQQVFSSAEAASAALVSAVRSNDEKTMLRILGPGAEPIVSSGDLVEDSENRANFVRKYDEMHRLVEEPDGTVTLYVGAENWPTPIPIRSQAGSWYFDTKAAEEEILYRRIGRNEMSAIVVCQALVSAQKEYFEEHKQYASKIVSDDKRHDGLYWKASDGAHESPIGPLLAAAAVDDGGIQGQSDTATPYRGYYFRTLTRQGKHAPGSARKYIARGKMTGGFAFLAYPAEYRSSGVMTFIVSADGLVYEKDLGEKTAVLAKKIKEYNPDATWREAEAPSQAGNTHAPSPQPEL